MNRQGFKRSISSGMFLFILIAISFSCLDENLTDIRIDRSTRWKPDLSLPVGKGNLTINNYFEKFTVRDTFPLDTFPVFYEDSLYELDVYQIESSWRLNHSLSDYIDSSGYIDYLEVNTRIWNTYPTNSELQVYFNNRSGQALDSLFEEYKIIKGARLSKNGRVLKPGRQEFDVTLKKESIKSLFNYDHLLMKARIFVIGEDLDTVRFYSDYEVKFEMAMRVKLNVHPSELNN